MSTHPPGTSIKSGLYRHISLPTHNSPPSDGLLSFPAPSSLQVCRRAPNPTNTAPPQANTLCAHAKPVRQPYCMTRGVMLAHERHNP